MDKFQAAESSQRRATYQDVLDAPPNKVAEVIDGKLHTHSRPASPHAKAYSFLGGLLNLRFEHGDGGPGGWWIINEPELHLGDDILVPDIAGWRRSGMPVYPNVKYFTQSPDWVCEILSPSTRHIDLGRKRAIYAREGVEFLWIVDADARSLDAYMLRKGKWELIDTLSEDADVALPPFEAVCFNLNRLWLPRTVHRELQQAVPEFSAAAK